RWFAMAPSTYTCPECRVTLKPTKPFPPGKKVKCPKCGAIFATPAPAARPRQAIKAAPASPAPPAQTSEEEGMVNAFQKAEAADDQFEEERKRAAMGVVLDRAPKSKRGPAMAIVVAPSNVLMAAALINCLVHLFCACIWVWPVIFNEH